MDKFNGVNTLLLTSTDSHPSLTQKTLPLP